MTTTPADQSGPTNGVGTIRRVRAEPGGAVRLTVGPAGWTAGWTVGRVQEPRLDVEQRLGLGLLGFVVLAGLVHAAFHQSWLTWIFLVAAGLCLLVLLLLGIAQVVGTVVGAAWLAGSALTRGGRRKLADGTRDVWARVAADRAEYTVAADQVRGVQVSRGFAGTTTVAVSLADGGEQRYSSWWSRSALAAAFS